MYAREEVAAGQERARATEWGSGHDEKGENEIFVKFFIIFKLLVFNWTRRFSLLSTTESETRSNRGRVSIHCNKFSTHLRVLLLLLRRRCNSSPRCYFNIYFRLHLAFYRNAEKNVYIRPAARRRRFMAAIGIYLHSLSRCAVLSCKFVVWILHILSCSSSLHMQYSFDFSLT